MDRLDRQLRRIFHRGRGESSVSARYRAVCAASLAVMVTAGSLFLAHVLVDGDHQDSSAYQAGALAWDMPRRDAALAAAAAETRRNPADATPWLRRAWIEASASAVLTPAANAALLRSYELAPFGPETTLWRLGFIFDHWSSASPEVRDLALHELRVVYRQRGWDIEALARTAVDPTGRMVATLASRRLRAIERLDAQGDLRRP